MPSPKRSTGRRAQQMSARDFERSNSTAEAFLGGKQKAWITGQSPEALSKPLSAEPGYPTSRSQGPVPDTSTSSSPQTTVQEEAMTTSTPVPISVSTKPSSTADNVLPSPSPSVSVFPGSNIPNTYSILGSKPFFWVHLFSGTLPDVSYCSLSVVKAEC